MVEEASSREFMDALDRLERYTDEDYRDAIASRWDDSLTVRDAIKNLQVQRRGYERTIRTVRQVLGLPEKSPDFGNDLMDRLDSLSEISYNTSEATSVPFIFQRLTRLVAELRNRVDANAEDVGHDARSVIEILRDICPTVSEAERKLAEME